MSRNRSDGLLARVDFPLYTLQTLTDRHILVAGGGGAANTGVANGFEIFELSHNGTRYVAEEVMRYETGPNVVMTCAIQSVGSRTYLTAGQESHCQLYRVNTKVVDAAEMRRGSFKAENGLIRRRRRTISENDNISKTDKNSNTTERRMTFEIRPCESVQTDFGDDPLQRVVRLSHGGALMATGGTDARVRLWAFPKMKLLYEFDRHTKEIDDLDFSPCDGFLVSIAKDGLALVWPTTPKVSKTPKAPVVPALTLACQPPNGAKYLFRRCRFGRIEEQPGSYRLFSIANPLSRSGRQRGVLQQWSRDGALTKSVLATESLASLTVRDDGRFVGVGTMFSGSVDIYIAFSLQRVLHVPRAHMMFVTGVVFLPAAGPAARADAALLSISIDNAVCLHTVDYPSTVPAWAAVLLIIFALFCTFTVCSYLGI